MEFSGFEHRENTGGEVAQSPEHKAFEEVADLPEEIGGADELQDLPTEFGRPEPAEGTEYMENVTEQGFPRELEAPPVQEAEAVPEATVEAPEGEGPTDDAAANEGSEEDQDDPATKQEAENHPDDPENMQENEGLTEEQKAFIKKDSKYSDEIINYIKSMKEYFIYKKAGLVEAEIGGKKCLIRQDIDMDQKDEFGRTNRERMANGNPPLTKNGEVVELHHIGQKQDSPLAELTTQEHRGKGNDTILHDKQKESEIDRGEFAVERRQYWENRAENSQEVNDNEQ